MRVVSAKVILESHVNGPQILRRLERIGRVCYKSEDCITKISAERFVVALLKRGHESVLEHISITVRIICDRGVSHEIVRHRIASYSQESTRYCNYKQKGMVFIQPKFLYQGAHDVWFQAMLAAEKHYLKLLELGASPQEARSVLPNSLKTELVVTYNLRQWRHVLRLRTEKAAHPQMREVMIPVLYKLKERIPLIFDDILAFEGGD